MKADSHIAPYLAKSITPVFGLNHLGLRNAAEDLFTTLLPGLNGVTLRVRYYSFYCWITGEARKVIMGKPDPAEEFRLFIRKSEILLALINAYRDPTVTGIPGIDYARNILNQEHGDIDLVRCVHRPENSRDTTGTYWANRGGILRQYYNASLKDMALLPSLKDYPSISVPSQVSDDLPEDTILGETLGQAFAQSIGEKASERFLSCVLRSSVSDSDLKKMQDSFIMKDFGEIGPERDLLIDTFNQKDVPDSELNNRFLRRDTIRLFLDYTAHDRAEGLRDAEQFPTVIYEKVLDGELNDACSLGWYAYHINDRWQYHSSVVFRCLLDILDKDSGWVSVKDLSDSLSKEMYHYLVKKEGLSLGEVCNLIDEGVIDNLDHKTTGGVAADAMVSLLRLYCENRIHPDIVESYKNAFKDIRIHHSDFFTYMDELDGLQESSFLDFLRDFLVTKIIYQHHTVSLLKYSATGIASNKFLLEDGYLRFLEQTECTATAPRIVPLIEYLTDLGLLKDMAPTPDAIERYGLN